MIIENGNIVLLTWERNYEINNVKVLIDPKISGMFIDEELLKKSLNDISDLSCLFGSQFEVSIELSISSKISPHSFYISVMPSADFPKNYREDGIGLILGKSWIELTNYQIEQY